MTSYRPPPRGINAHYAIAAVAITVLINRRKDIKLIPGLLQQNRGKTRKVGVQQQLQSLLLSLYEYSYDLICIYNMI